MDTKQEQIQCAGDDAFAAAVEMMSSKSSVQLQAGEDLPKYIVYPARLT